MLQFEPSGLPFLSSPPMGPTEWLPSAHASPLQSPLGLMGDGSACAVAASGDELTSLHGAPEMPLELGKGGHAAAAALEDEPPSEEATTEQLDWGSIDDEDGAFGQIGAALGANTAANLEDPGRQIEQLRESIDGAAAATSLSVDTAGGFTPPVEELMAEGGMTGGASGAATAHQGRSNGGDPASPEMLQAGGTSPATHDGDKSGSAAGRDITTAAAPSGFGSTRASGNHQAEAEAGRAPSASSASEKDAAVAVGWVPPRTRSPDNRYTYTCSAVLQRESSASIRGSLFQEGRASSHDGDATNPRRSDICGLPLSASALDWVITH